MERQEWRLCAECGKDHELKNSCGQEGNCMVIPSPGQNVLCIEDSQVGCSKKNVETWKKQDGKLCSFGSSHDV